MSARAITLGEAMEKVLHHECPDCTGRLHRDGAWLACEQCHARFRLQQDERGKSMTAIGRKVAR